MTIPRVVLHHPAVLSALLSGAFLVTAGASRAQSVGGLPLRSGERAFVELANNFTASPWTHEVSTLQWSPQLSAGARLGRRFDLTMNLAAASTVYRVYNAPGESAFRLGNPFLAAHFAPLSQDRLTLRVGLGVAPPLTTSPGSIPKNVAAAYTYEVAAEARGFQGYWLWAPNVVPVAALVNVEYLHVSGVVLSGGVQAAYLQSVNSRPSHVALLVNGTIGFRVGLFTPALRLQSCLDSRALAANDFAQTSMAAQVTADQGRAYVRVEYVMNLDGPYGVAGGARNTTVWGGSLGGGVRF